MMMHGWSSYLDVVERDVDFLADEFLAEEFSGFKHVRNVIQRARSEQKRIKRY